MVGMLGCQILAYFWSDHSLDQILDFSIGNEVLKMVFHTTSNLVHFWAEGCHILIFWQDLKAQSKLKKSEQISIWPVPCCLDFYPR